MMLKRRLEGLERPTQTAHAAAWGRFWRAYRTSLEPVLRASRDAPGFAALLDDDRTGSVDWSLPEPAPQLLLDLDVWHLSAAILLPDPDSLPGIERWPDDFPMPPDEPDGIWSRCWSYLSDPDTEACAGVLLMGLGFARTVRHYQTGSPTSHTFGGYDRE